MIEEVVQRVLAKDQHKTKSALDHIEKLQAQLQRELDDLSRAHRKELDKSSQKKMKREMEWKWKDLKGLEATISEYESHLRGDCGDGSSNSGT